MDVVVGADVEADDDAVVFSSGDVPKEICTFK